MRKDVPVNAPGPNDGRRDRNRDGRPDDERRGGGYRPSGQGSPGDRRDRGNPPGSSRRSGRDAPAGGDRPRGERGYPDRRQGDGDRFRDSGGVRGGDRSSGGFRRDDRPAG